MMRIMAGLTKAATVRALARNRAPSSKAAITALRFTVDLNCTPFRPDTGNSRRA